MWQCRKKVLLFFSFGGLTLRPPADILAVWTGHFIPGEPRITRVWFRWKHLARQSMLADLQLQSRDRGNLRGINRADALFEDRHGCVD